MTQTRERIFFSKLSLIGDELLADTESDDELMRSNSQ